MARSGRLTAAARRLGSGRARDEVFVAPEGKRLIVAGSCSERTLAQVAAFDGPHYVVDVARAIEEPRAVRDEALALVAREGSTVLVQASAPPDVVRANQATFGRARSAEVVESVLADVARTAVADLRVRRLLLAGGETSGAVTAALGIRRLAVGPSVAPGVPWLLGGENPAVAVLLKSGNFGPVDLFETAWDVLDEPRYG